MQKLIVLGAVLIAAALPTASALADYKGETSAWVPYWVEEKGLKEVIDHIDELDVIYPFVYEVDASGELVEKADLTKGVWEDLIEAARDEDVLVVPTVAWFDGAAIHETLKNRRDRKALIADIADLVDDNDFDGINIDFESKKSETINYFSTFLKDLNKKLGRDDLSCTIEARTPPEDLYPEGKVPKKINYANDYQAINKYCDWVEIMAYDQQRADLTLNKERRGVPYAPVADIDWVEKVVDLATKDIDEDKIVLGIPLYGRAWDVTVAPEWYKDYTRVAALNYSRIVELSKDVYKVPMGRSAGGEGVISYFPDDSPYKIFNQLPAPVGTPKGYEAAAKALMVANYTGMEIPVRFVMFGDAEAAEQKIELAEKYDLKGVAFWSLNGEEDEDIWDLF